jgi:hypothetical protein
MDKITIATFSNPVDAHIAKDLLQRENIICFLADENISRIYPTSVFGIRLMVDKDNASNARKILQENGLLKD